MSEADVKICPQCAGEFHSWVSQCPDCEVDLLSPADLATQREANARQTVVAADLKERLDTVPRLDPNEGHLFKVGSQNECLQTATSLAARGIPWRIAPLYGIFILDDDHDDAQQALQEDALEGVPDVQPAKSDRDDGCPACSHRLQESDTECPECGLVLG